MTILSLSRSARRAAIDLTIGLKRMAVRAGKIHRRFEALFTDFGQPAFFMNR